MINTKNSKIKNSKLTDEVRTRISDSFKENVKKLFEASL